MSLSRRAWASWVICCRGRAVLADLEILDIFQILSDPVTSWAINLIENFYKNKKFYTRIVAANDYGIFIWIPICFSTTNQLCILPDNLCEVANCLSSRWVTSWEIVSFYMILNSGTQKNANVWENLPHEDPWTSPYQSSVDSAPRASESGLFWFKNIIAVKYITLLYLIVFKFLFSTTRTQLTEQTRIFIKPVFCSNISTFILPSTLKNNIYRSNLQFNVISQIFWTKSLPQLAAIFSPTWVWAPLSKVVP